MRREADIEYLVKKRDIKALIRLLKDHDEQVQWKTAAALGKLGKDAVPDLIPALHHKNLDVRLGVIEALGDIKDSAAIPPLIARLQEEESEEVRWAIALTLGEIANQAAIPVLVNTLQDQDAYVRYGAARSLQRLGWIPRDTVEKTWFLIGMQKWEEIQDLGEDAVDPLVQILSYPNSRIRLEAVEVLGELRSPKATLACDRALIDPAEEVRWRAILSFPHCGLPLSHLVRGLNKRPRTANNPLIAAFLNFLFLGMGYNYLGKWWGFLLFQLNVTFIVVLSLLIGPTVPYLFSYAYSALFSIHAWIIAKNMPDL